MLETHFIGFPKLFLLSLFLLQMESFFCPIEYVLCLFPQKPEKGRKRSRGFGVYIRALIEGNGTLNKGPFDEVSFTNVGYGSHHGRCSGLWSSSSPAVTCKALMTGGSSQGVRIHYTWPFPEGQDCVQGQSQPEVTLQRGSQGNKHIYTLTSPTSLLLTAAGGPVCIIYILNTHTPSS